MNRAEICFWSSSDKHEVDFIIYGKIGIEVKSTKKINSNHLIGLKALQEENKLNYFYIISDDPIEKISDKIHHMNWKSFLTKLWSGKIF